MELIATARFKKAMDRASVPRLTPSRSPLVADLAQRSGSQPPAAEPREKLIVPSCWSSPAIAVFAAATIRMSSAPPWSLNELTLDSAVELEISGKRGLSAFKFRTLYEHVLHALRRQAHSVKWSCWPPASSTFSPPARSIAWMWPTPVLTASQTNDLVETFSRSPRWLCPISESYRHRKPRKSRCETQYEFLPSAASILEEVVPPVSKSNLFKCFLDAAVSEQIARKVAMKAATENADKIIKRLR